MKIFLKNIKHYFLTVYTNSIKKYHLLEEFKEYDLIEVNPIINIGKNKSGATGFSKMIDLGLRNQDRLQSFQPFVIYEDDISKYREYPEYIEIPDDADLCYIGLSKYSMTKDSSQVCSFYKNIDENIIQIFNMLSTHGIIVCSASGALAIQKAVLEAYQKDIIWDIFIAQIQPYYKVYALKQPLVFQDSKYNGWEQDTRFSIKSNDNCPLPEDYINTTNDSIITCCKISN